MSGQIVDFFDTDFRETYAASEELDLYGEFNVTKPPLLKPALKPQVEPVRPLPVSTSRFQVSVGDSRQINLKVPAHKYHNPKYALVFGNSLGLTRSLQDLSTQNDSLCNGLDLRNGLHASRDKAGPGTPLSPGSPARQEDEDGKGAQLKNQTGNTKRRSSFRHFLKGRGDQQSTETIQEGVVTPQSPAHTGKGAETNGVAGRELEDSFEMVERPELLKVKPKRPSKVLQKSLSLQTINTGNDEGTSFAYSFNFLFWTQQIFSSLARNKHIFLYRIIKRDYHMVFVKVPYLPVDKSQLFA